MSSTYLTFDQTLETSRDQLASTSRDLSNQAYTPYTILSPSTRKEPTFGSGDPSTYAQLEMSYMPLDASSRDLPNPRQLDPSSTYIELDMPYLPLPGPNQLDPSSTYTELDMPYMHLDASSSNVPRPNQPGLSSTYTELEMPPYLMLTE